MMILISCIRFVKQARLLPVAVSPESPGAPVDETWWGA